MSSPQDDLDDRCTCSDCTGEDWDWDGPDDEDDDQPPMTTVTPPERFL